MNGAAALFTNFGFSIKKILAIIIAILLLILMFPILAISSLGLSVMSFLANAPSAKAMILDKLKADAEAYLGETITETIITVPAYFTDSLTDRKSVV